MAKCPKCGVRLSRVRFQGLPVRSCPDCSGELVEEPTLKALKRKATPCRPDDQQAFLCQAANSANESAPLRCPRCRRLMDKVQLPDCGNLQVDVCSRCKVYWLDACELEAMQIQRDEALSSMSPEEREHLEEMRRVNAAMAIRRDSYERLRREGVPGAISGRGFAGRSPVGALFEAWQMLEAQQQEYDAIDEQSLRIASMQPARDSGGYIPWRRFRDYLVWAVIILVTLAVLAFKIWWLRGCR